MSSEGGGDGDAEGVGVVDEADVGLDEGSDDGNSG